VIESDVPPNSKQVLGNGLLASSEVSAEVLQTLLELNMSLLSTLSWWITDGILLDNSTDSSFFLLTPLHDTPYRRMGMSYQVE
jgi:hypothetical protein